MLLACLKAFTGEMTKNIKQAASFPLKLLGRVCIDTDYKSQRTEFSRVKSYQNRDKLSPTSCDSKWSGRSLTVPCAASTCGARVNGTSLRSSAVSELFSGVWPAWFPVSGPDTVTLDVSSLPVSEDWLPSASEVLHLTSFAVSPKRTNPSASGSGTEGFLDSAGFRKK